MAVAGHGEGMGAKGDGNIPDASWQAGLKGGNQVPIAP